MQHRGAVPGNRIPDAVARIVPILPGSYMSVPTLAVAGSSWPRALLPRAPRSRMPCLVTNLPGLNGYHAFLVGGGAEIGFHGGAERDLVAGGHNGRRDSKEPVDPADLLVQLVVFMFQYVYALLGAVQGCHERRDLRKFDCVCVG